MTDNKPIRPRISEGQAAIVLSMTRYLAGLLDPFVSLLEVHKMMYLLQEAGQPLRLDYVKAPYGPYAKNLGKVLSRIEGHFIEGYADGGDDPTKQLSLLTGADGEAKKLLDADKAMQGHFQRVSQLVDGFESPFGMELLSTVHWVSTREEPCSASELTARVYAWNDRKRQFTPRQIDIAMTALTDHGWINRLPAESAE